MMKLVAVQLFVLATVSTVLGINYDDTFTRYKVWPMASAAYSDDPGSCVKSNFADSKVRDY